MLIKRSVSAQCAPLHTLVYALNTHGGSPFKSRLRGTGLPAYAAAHSSVRFNECTHRTACTKLMFVGRHRVANTTISLMRVHGAPNTTTSSSSSSTQRRMMMTGTKSKTRFMRCAHAARVNPIRGAFFLLNVIICLSDASVVVGIVVGDHVQIRCRHGHVRSGTFCVAQGVGKHATVAVTDAQRGRKLFYQKYN